MPALLATAQCHASRPEAWCDGSREPSGDTSPASKLASRNVRVCAVLLDEARRRAAPRRPQPSMAQNKAWQAFDTSTEAGRMLKKLYGSSAGHPNIAYPKLPTKPRKHMPKFIPGGAKLDATDARSNSHRREKASTVEP